MKLVVYFNSLVDGGKNRGGKNVFDQCAAPPHRIQFTQESGSIIDGEKYLKCRYRLSRSCFDSAEKLPDKTTSPNRTGGAMALELCACLNPANGPRAIHVGEILSPSLRARIGIFGSAAAMKYASPAAMAPVPKKTFRKAPWLGHPPKPYWRHYNAKTAPTP